MVKIEAKAKAINPQKMTKIKNFLFLIPTQLLVQTQ